MKKTRRPKTEYVSDEETVRRVVERIAAVAPDLKPRVDEHPEDVFWIVVRTRDGRALSFTAGDQFWEGDLYEHVHGTGSAKFDGITTELPSTTTDPEEVAATIIANVGGAVGNALARAGRGGDLALQTATKLWAEATTADTSQRRKELIHDKQAAVHSFFEFSGKHPAEVKPADVQAWRSNMEGEGLKPATVYARLSRLSSFYSWLAKSPRLSGAAVNNPVETARPRAPRAYQGEATKSLSDDELRRLTAVVRGKADAGSVVAKRDYALLVIYSVTGLRRSEVINLRGSDLEEEDGTLVLKTRNKGGTYSERELCDPEARDALSAYLRASGRDLGKVIGTPRALWTRHDRAGAPGAPLTSHAFARNLKLYAKAAGIKKIHVHQLRHTFGRMVADETGSITEVQDALGHANASTTRVYVRRIQRKRDRFSRRISERMRGEA